MALQKKSIPNKELKPNNKILKEVPKTSQNTKTKSGIKNFKAGDILFKEGEIANSLYIIQEGQIRLFRPKGKGYIDIAILRAGEVIGEMAYFDEDTSKRSVSASCIVNTKVVEISFVAFAKTMKGLNPWFKTIINTLADRLRKTNEKVKSLESNSLGFGKDGKEPDYVFFHTIDVIRILSTIFFVGNTHGEEVSMGTKIDFAQLKFYMFDVYNVYEIKFEEFINFLVEKNIIMFAPHTDGESRKLIIPELLELKKTMMFLNSQKMLDDKKKLTISPECELILKSILEQSKVEGVIKPKWQANITVILSSLREKGNMINEGHFYDAISTDLAEDLIVDKDGVVTSVIYLEKLKKLFSSISIINAIKLINEKKARGHQKLR